MNVFQSIKVSLGALLLALVASAMLTACSSDEETTEAPPAEETSSGGGGESCLEKCANTGSDSDECTILCEID